MSDQFAALDIEATGMDPSRHDVIEVAVVVFSREREIDRFASLVRPRGRLSLDMAGLTGINPRDLQAAPAIDQLASVLRRMTAGRPIVGHSVELDIAMLDAAGVSLPSVIYDTHLLATLLLPELPNYSLHAVASALGIEERSGHRALADAVVTAEVFRALLAKIESLDATTLERVAVLGRTAGWPVADLFLAAARRQPAGPLFAQQEAERTPPLEMRFLVPMEKPEPLRRTGSKAPVDERSVAAALAPGGAFSQVAPAYEHRPAQEVMARAVTRAFNADRHLLVEAGTGTGKSVAYLLPAVLHARERGETVVVSTNTLALQDQLFRKDIPDLQRALAGADGSVPFEAAILKGRQNYLCLRRWFAAQRQPVSSPEEASLRAKILLWLGSTATGDRAELRLSAEEEAEFRRVSAEGEACVPAKCVFNQRNQCFLFRARRQAEHAHIVVVNHALLLSDTVEGGTVLPDYERLIVDEAHHLEDQATTQFGFSVSENAVLDILDTIIKPDGSAFGGLIQSAINELMRLATDAESRARVATAVERGRQLLGRMNSAKMATNDLFLRLRDLVDQEGMGAAGYDRSVRLTRSIRRRGEWMEAEIAWERLDRELTAIESELVWFLETLERAIPDESDTAENILDLTEDVVLELTNALRALADLRVKLAESVIDPSAGAVYWVERDVVRGGVSLRAAPLHVGPLLRDRLFAPLRTAVLTSATLTTDGSFDYIRDRVGLEDVEEVSVPSPFDYERSTLLYLVDDIPEPNAPRYQKGVEEALVDLAIATGGRMLVLFTSHAALQATYRAIRVPLEDHGVVVLAQRTDGSARQLIERLKHASNIVLLGTSTFWEGVDIVGPALSVLVMTKLPFAVPSDPIFAARSEGFEDPFTQYAVPQAVLKFKQGFGRLIRSSQDRGICAILDRRVLTKRYGQSFIHSLPQCSVIVGSASELPRAAVEWLEQPVVKPMQRDRSASR